MNKKNKKIKKELLKCIKKLSNYGDVCWNVDVVNFPSKKKPITKYIINIYLDENI